MNKKLFELAEDIKKYMRKAITINEILKTKVNTYNLRNNDMIFSLNDDELKKFSDKELENIEKVKEYYVCNALLDVISSELEINSLYQYVKINDLSTERVFQLYKEWAEITKAPYPLYLDNCMYKVFSEDKDLSLSDSIKTLYFNQNPCSITASYTLGYPVNYYVYRKSFSNKDINKLGIAINNMFYDNYFSMEKIVKTDEFKDICKKIDDLDTLFKNTIDINKIQFSDLDISVFYPNNERTTVYSAYIDEIDELDEILGIKTETNHNECFQVNYYCKLLEELDDSNFSYYADECFIVATVTLFDKDLLYEQFPDIADNVDKLSKYASHTVSAIKFNNELLKDKFIAFIESERIQEEEREL